MPPRLSQGAGPEGLNLRIVRHDQTAHWNPALMRPDSVIFKVKDIFTTLNGSWEVGATQVPNVFGIEQWARDAYLAEPGNPRMYPGGGGYHHIHVCVERNGERRENLGVAFTSDGVEYLQPPTDYGHLTLRSTESHGWCNLPIYAPGSNPPAPGPWSVAMLGVSDLVTGIGLPWNWHVATFVVFEAKRWDELQTTPLTFYDHLRAQAQAHQVVQLNPQAALQESIYAAGFQITSGEFDFVYGDPPVTYRAQRAEHLATGEVRAYYCVVPDWSIVQHLSWMPTTA